MQAIAIVVFFMLATSSVSAVAIVQQDPLDENSASQVSNEKLQQNDDAYYIGKGKSQVTEYYDIIVSENFGIADNDQEKKLTQEITRIWKW